MKEDSAEKMPSQRADASERLAIVLEPETNQVNRSDFILPTGSQSPIAQMSPAYELDDGKMMIHSSKADGVKQVNINLLKLQ